MAPSSVLVCFFLAILLTVCKPSVGKPPNIVYVFADDYGWNDIGYHGSEIHTPNLDELARKGVKLDNYYVQPICTPSRSQFMSGRYQIHTGLQHSIIWMTQPNGLPLNLPTVADVLKNQGYATHAVGKWHLGFYKKEYMPTSRGFDSFYGYLGGSEDYFTHNRGDIIHFNGTSKVVNGLDLRDNLNPDWTKHEKYSTHLFAKKAQDLVETHSQKNPDKPMFLYLPFQAVHSPLEVPEEYKERYSFIKNHQRRTFAGMVSCMDEAIGNITGTMKKLGFWENTVFIFSTDNGGQVHEGGNNWPLRGWKTQLWEGGVRGVGFVNSPLIKKPGRSTKELMHVSDWFPTIVSIAGGNTTGLKLDGHSQWDTISNGAPGPRHELLHNIDPMYPRKGHRWPNSTFDNTVRAAIRTEEWKLITGDPGKGTWVPPPHLSHLEQTPQDGDEKNLWLFNIRNDPLEKVDLSHQYPDIVHALLNRLAAYNQTAVPPFYPPEDPQCDPALHGGVWGPWRS